MMNSSRHTPLAHKIRGNTDVLADVERRLADERPASMRAPVVTGRHAYDLASLDALTPATKPAGALPVNPPPP